MKTITRRARASAPKMHTLSKKTRRDAISLARQSPSIVLRGDSRLIAAVQRIRRRDSP